MQLDQQKGGVAAHHDLKGLAIGQVQLIYKGRYTPSNLSCVEIECEIYEVSGVLSVHTVCPRCRHAQWINGTQKKIEYDRTAKTLHIEPFQCPWELEDSRQDFGVGLCRAKLAYEGKTARDA